MAKNLSVVLGVNGVISSVVGSALSGGNTNQLVYQTAANTTGFIAAPATINTVLSYNGTSIVWASSGASIATTSLVLKGNNAGGAVEATAGTDYLTPTSTVIGSGITMNGYQTMSVGGAAFTGYTSLPAVAAVRLARTNGESILWGVYNSKPAFFSDADNYMDLGANGTINYSWKNIYLNNSPVITSDKREKTFISHSTGLDFINKLNPVVYTWNIGGYIKDESETAKVDNGVGGDESPNLIPVPGVRHHYGLFAQEVKQAMTDCGMNDFGGWVSANINDPEAKQLLRYEEFIAPLIKSIQELSARIVILENNANL